MRVGDAVARAIKKTGVDEPVWLRRLEREWVELVGTPIAKHARPGRYANGQLVVFVDSAVWLNELKRYGRRGIISKLQERFGAETIKNVVLQPDPEGHYGFRDAIQISDALFKLMLDF